MRDETDLARTNEMRAEGVTLARIPESKDGNAVRVEGKRPDKLPHLNVDVVSDVMQKVMPLRWGEFFIPMGNNNGVAFMAFVVPTTNVDCSPGSAMLSSILNEHRQGDERLRINGEVRHGHEGSGSWGGGRRSGVVKGDGSGRRGDVKLSRGAMRASWSKGGT
jgi:hypothetical protein